MTIEKDIKKLNQDLISILFMYHYIDKDHLGIQLDTILKKYYPNIDQSTFNHYRQILMDNIIINLSALLDVENVLTYDDKQKILNNPLDLFSVLSALAVNNELLKYYLDDLNGNTDFRNVDKNIEDTKTGFDLAIEFGSLLALYPGAIIEWVWNPNERTRHSNMDGKRVKLGELFTVEHDDTGQIDFGYYPKDPQISIENSVNCLCTYNIIL